MINNLHCLPWPALALVLQLNIIINHENPRSSLVQPVGDEVKKQLCSLGLKSWSYKSCILPETA